MNPQASWLSLAAFGNGLNVDGLVKRLPPAAGAMAVRTASSKHSYSTSLITLSGYQERTITKYFCVQIEVIDKIVSNFSMGRTGYRRLYSGGRVSQPDVTKCVENHSWPKIFDVFALMKTAPHRPPVASGGCHEGKFADPGYRKPRQSCFGAHTASQPDARWLRKQRRNRKKACTPDVYRLCPGEIPNVRPYLCCGGRRPASAKPAGRCSSSEELTARELRPHRRGIARRICGRSHMLGSPGWSQKILSGVVLSCVYLTG